MEVIMPDQHPIVIKKELIAKIRERYRDINGESLPADYTDDEIIATVILWFFEELV